MLRKCLFPAAGYGTRFLPATKAMPKEILPILNKPLIQYGVEEALDGGLDQIAIVTGRGKRAIEDHFDISYELEQQINGTSKENQLQDIRKLINECTFSYTRQIEMKGLGHAILTGETLIGKQAFGVILADDLCVGEGKNVMSQIIDIFDNCLHGKVSPGDAEKALQPYIMFGECDGYWHDKAGMDDNKERELVL